MQQEEPDFLDRLPGLENELVDRVMKGKRPGLQFLPGVAEPRQIGEDEMRRIAGNPVSPAVTVVDGELYLMNPEVSKMHVDTDTDAQAILAEALAQHPLEIERREFWPFIAIRMPHARTPEEAQKQGAVLLKRVRQVWGVELKREQVMLFVPGKAPAEEILAMIAQAKSGARVVGYASVSTERAKELQAASLGRLTSVVVALPSAEAAVFESAKPGIAFLFESAGLDVQDRVRRLANSLGGRETDGVFRILGRDVAMTQELRERLKMVKALGTAA